MTNWGQVKFVKIRYLLWYGPVVILGLSLLGRGAALAGGFFLYEVGTPDMGLASAGYAARAQDASTVFTNPAGMTLLDHSQILAGIQPIYGHLSFAPDASTTTRGTDGGNALVPLPSGSFFYVYSLNSRLKFGFATCTYFGGIALEYNLNWVGRYFLQGATAIGTSFIPAVAYRVNDWLSVGGGINVMLGFLREKAGVRNLTPGVDGQVKYQDYTAGVGGDIGVMLQADDKTRVGITYLTPVDLNFSSVPHFRGTGPVLTTLLAHRGFLGASVDLGITVPQTVMVSAYREISERMALLGTVNWQNWSQFGMVGIGINSANPRSLTTNLNYDDTWQIGAGMQYKVSPEFLLSAGFAYDSSMLSDGNRTVSAPVASQYRYAFGGQYQWTEHVRTGLAYEFFWEGKMPLSQSRQTGTTVSGQFTQTLVNFFSINLAYVF